MSNSKKITWDAEAAKRLAKAPFFVRPFVKNRAEQVARERGLANVTTQLLDELKSKEHQGGKLTT